MQGRFLEGSTALVTGSVQGIGLAVGKALASAGALWRRGLSGSPVQVARKVPADRAHQCLLMGVKQPHADMPLLLRLTQYGNPRRGHQTKTPARGRGFQFRQRDHPSGADHRRSQRDVDSLGLQGVNSRSKLLLTHSATPDSWFFARHA